MWGFAPRWPRSGGFWEGFAMALGGLSLAAQETSLPGNRMVVCGLSLRVHGCGGRRAQNSSCHPYPPCPYQAPASCSAPPISPQCTQLGNFASKATFSEPSRVLCPQKGSRGSERGSGWPRVTPPAHDDPLIKPSLQLQAHRCFRAWGWRRRSCIWDSSHLLAKL